MRYKDTLPHGIYRDDCYFGTIIAENNYGIRILLDIKDDVSEEKIYAFAFCNGSINQRALVSIRRFDERHGNFVARVDSYLSNQEALAISA